MNPVMVTSPDANALMGIPITPEIQQQLDKYMWLKFLDTVMVSYLGWSCITYDNQTIYIAPTSALLDMAKPTIHRPMFPFERPVGAKIDYQIATPTF